MDESIDAVTGFRYGGINSTDLIRQVASINGIAVDELEFRMRPHAMSDAGFLGADESLLEVMAEDNDWVLGMGLNHQMLAETLKFARAAFRNHMGGEDTEIIFHGRRFQITGDEYRGYQDSPFEDGLESSFNVHVTNVENGERVSFSGMMPEYIERYGFYEGHETSYRVAPEQIVKVFDFLAKGIASPTHGPSFGSSACGLHGGGIGSAVPAPSFAQHLPIGAVVPFQHAPVFGIAHGSAISASMFTLGTDPLSMRPFAMHCAL